jgi:ribosomal protein L11 methyltransferase
MQYNTTAIKQVSQYIELRCFIPGHATETREMVTAGLLDLGFEGFYEDDKVLVGYIPEISFPGAGIENLDIFRKAGIKYKYRLLEQKNWNEEWEKSYSPVIIANKCLVRAPFHPLSNRFPYELVIEPKMAFGTGHHPTTAMIAGYLLNTDIRGTHLFDFGCGTGILGILAFKRGAVKVWMADNDPYAVKNSIENIALNNAGAIEVFLGGIETIGENRPGLITANINRPVLLENMDSFFNSLKSGGVLVMSGMITGDMPVVLGTAKKAGFNIKNKSIRQGWAMLVVSKPEI